MNREQTTIRLPTCLKSYFGPPGNTKKPDGDQAKGKYD